MIVGFEEFVLGYNQLIERRLYPFLDIYVDNLKNLGEELKTPDAQVVDPVLKNKWHWVGVDDAIDYHYEERTEQERRRPLATFLNYPMGVEYKSYGSTCDWCGKQVTVCYHFIDALQDHAFCSLEHGRIHRLKLAAAIPQVAALYAPTPIYTFRPLPYRLAELKSYLKSLPISRLDPVLDSRDALDWSKYKPQYEGPVRIKKKRD